MYKNQKYLKALFEKFDLDKNGKISKDELRTVLSGDEFNIPKEQIEKMVKQADVNNDGEVLDFFLRWVILAFIRLTIMR